MTKLIAENRRARFDYYLEEKFEAGLSLTGSEIRAVYLLSLLALPGLGIILGGVVYLKRRR